MSQAETLGRATSASVARVPKEVTPHVPSKLIDKAVDKRLKMDRFGVVRKHPLRIVDLPSYTISMHLSEIPPGGRTGLHRHHNEALVYILEGRGYSEIEGRRIEWEAGDALYIPPWSLHAHYNIEMLHPARYLAATNSPLLQNIGGIDRREEKGVATLMPASKKGGKRRRGR